MTEEELRQNYDELAKSQHLLQESEKQYRNVVEDQTEFISRFKPDGTHIFVNEAYCRYFGMQRDEILGHRFRPTIPVEDQERVHRFFASLTQDHPAGTIRHRVIMPDGALRWHWWSDRAIFDKSGTVAEYQSVGRDITEEKITEIALGESKHRNAAMIAAMPDLLFVISRDGTCLDLRAGDKNLLALQPSEIIGKNLFEAGFDEDTKKTVLHAISAAIETDTLQQIEYKLSVPGGTSWFEARIVRLAADRVLGIVRDITKQKAAEDELKGAYDVLEDRVNQRTAELSAANLKLQKEIETGRQIESALKESEERFRTLIEKAPEAILLFDMDLDRYVEANAKAEQLFGCGRQQLFDAGPQQFYLPDQSDGRSYRETVPEHRKQVMAGAELVFERRIHNAHGKDRVVEVRLVRLPSSTKRLIRSSYIDITERKRIEAELKESEERYRTIVEQDYRSILENMQDIFYRSDRKGNLILMSPSGAALLGYAGTDEMLGGPATEYYADPAQREAILAALKKNQSVTNMEVTLKRRDGTPVTVSTSSHVYKDASGNYAGVEGIFRDITHLKAVQEELRQSEEQNRVLIEHTQDGAFIMQDGLLRFCNGAFAAMIGYTPGEIIGTPVPNLIAPEDRETVMGRQRDRLLGESLPESYEFRMLHKDAITRVLVILSVGTGTYRDRPAVIGTVRDVTREREREHALRESEGKYRSLVETSFDGIIIHQDGVFVYANRAAVRLLGAGSADELMGKPILSCVHPDFRTVVHQRMESATAETQPVIREKFLRTDGSSFDVDVVAIPFVWKDRPAVHVVFRDITERKRSDDALRLANRQLTLLTGITRHDILNNVSMARGYLKIAGIKSGDPAQAEYLRKMESAIIAIKSQIEFTKIYKDLGIHDPQWIVLDTVMPRSHVPKTITLDADIRGVMLFSDLMLEKVFFNLLDNSLRHGERVTEIRVSSHTSDGNLVVVWEDNGTGVAADQKERIFERGVGKHTGLGLFLVREILGLTGITIAETGQPGKGARFEITVPKGAYRFAGTQ